MAWYMWVLLYLAVGLVFSYFMIRSMTKNTHGGELDIFGTQYKEEKYEIVNTKNFMKGFIFLTIAGIPLFIFIGFGLIVRG